MHVGLTSKLWFRSRARCAWMSLSSDLTPCQMIVKQIPGKTLLKEQKDLGVCSDEVTWSRIYAVCTCNIHVDTNKPQQHLRERFYIKSYMEPLLPNYATNEHAMKLKWAANRRIDANMDKHTLGLCGITVVLSLIFNISLFWTYHSILVYTTTQVFWCLLCCVIVWF